MTIRVRNLLAKFCEFCVYKVIASHPSKPKIRNMSPNFPKLAKAGAELINYVWIGTICNMKVDTTSLRTHSSSDLTPKLRSLQLAHLGDQMASEREGYGSQSRPQWSRGYSSRTLFADHSYSRHFGHPEPKGAPLRCHTVTVCHNTMRCKVLLRDCVKL